MPNGAVTDLMQMKKSGLASLCIGGGQGFSMVLESV